MQSKINENSYNLKPFLYDIRGFFILTLSYRNSIFYQLHFFAKNLKGKHLECAIGTGTLTKLTLLYKYIFFSKQKTELYGVDYSDALLAGARKKLKSSTVLKEDLRAMSFPDNTFDSVNFPNGYHTIDGVEVAMKEIVRVLKPGGTLHVNILLYPKQRLLDPISRKINSYGKSIGILKRPYHLVETHQALIDYELEVIEYKVKQNCVYFICKKKASS